MNAPHFHAEAKSHLMANPSAAFLKNLSVEITPRQMEKLPLLQERLPKGTSIFIALIDPADEGGQLTAATALRKAGLEPIPHVPARFVLDETDLKNRIGALAWTSSARMASRSCSSHTGTTPKAALNSTPAAASWAKCALRN